MFRWISYYVKGWVLFIVIREYSCWVSYNNVIYYVNV